MRIAIVVLATIASVLSIASEVLMERRTYDFAMIGQTGSGDAKVQAELRRNEAAIELRRTMGEYLAGAMGVVAAVLALCTLQWRRFAVVCAVLLAAAAVILLVGTNVFPAMLFGLAALLSLLKAFLVRGASLEPVKSLLQLLDVSMIAVVSLAIVASVLSVGHGSLASRPNGIAPTGPGSDSATDVIAVALREKVGAYLAGGIGMIAAVLALCCLETRRGAMACSASLVVATMVVAIWTVNYPLAILFTVATGLSFQGAFLARGVSAVPAAALLPWALRIVGLLFYLSGAALLCGWVSWPLYVLWRGYPFPQVTWPLQIAMCAVSLVILALGLLLARWGANRFYAGVTIPKGTFTGHLLAVPVAGILCWLAIARPEGDDDIAQLFFVGGIALFLVATIDGLITLIRYKPFRWHIYILMGLGVGCAFASLTGPTFFATHAIIRSAQRSSTFATASARVGSAVSYKDLANAIREPKRVRGLGSLEGALLVLDAQFDGREGPCHTRVSHAEWYLPQTWLAKDEQSICFVVAIGPFGFLPSSQIFGSPTWGCPFLVFDWPKCELIQQGTLRLSQPGGMPREHHPDATEGRLCNVAKELAQQLLSASAPTGGERISANTERRRVENVPSVAPPPVSAPPKPEEIAKQYDRDVRPLIERLQKAEKAPTGYKVPDVGECEIVLVPLSGRLFYVQQVLFPGRRFGKIDSPRKLYWIFELSRGTSLRFDVPGLEFVTAAQEAVVETRLIAEETGILYLVHQKKGVGGAGAHTQSELVSRAVAEVALGGEAATEANSALRKILAYGAGIDEERWMPGGPRLSASCRTAVLVSTLSSDSWVDRRSALEALGEMGLEARQAVPSLIRSLGDQNQDVRFAAVHAVGSIGPDAKAAIPALTKGLDDGYWLFRRDVATTLGQIGSEAREAIPALIRLLGDDESETADAAQQALERCGCQDQETARRALQSVNDPSPDVRHRAVCALGRVGRTSKETVPVLIKAMEDERAPVRAAAAGALRRIAQGTSDAMQELNNALVATVPVLIKALRDEESCVRYAAAGALARIHPAAKEAVPVLTKALGDKGYSVRGDAAEALGWIGADAKEAVPALTELIRKFDTDPVNCAKAAQALGQIGPEAKQSLPALIEALGVDRYPIVRAAAADALGRMGPHAREAVPALTKALGDSFPDVRVAAVEALGKTGLGGHAAIPALTGLLQDQESRVRQAAADALARIKANK